MKLCSSDNHYTTAPLKRRSRCYYVEIYYKNTEKTVEEKIAQHACIFKQLMLVHEEYNSLLDKLDNDNGDE